MSVLLIAENNNKEVRPFTLNAITAALQMDGDVHVLLVNVSEPAIDTKAPLLIAALN